MNYCTNPPAGWACTRTAGHEGPCAAVPSTPLPEEGRREEAQPGTTTASRQTAEVTRPVIIDNHPFTLDDVREYLNLRSANPFLEAALYMLDRQAAALSRVVAEREEDRPIPSSIPVRPNEPLAFYQQETADWIAGFYENGTWYCGNDKCAVAVTGGTITHYVYLPKMAPLALSPNTSNE